MQGYQELKMYVGEKIADAISVLRKNPKSFVKFNGHIVTSDMTEDQIYKEITGKTKEEFDFDCLQEVQQDVMRRIEAETNVNTLNKILKLLYNINKK